MEVSGLLDADVGGPVWAYTGLPEARERYARAAAAGAAVVSRAYLEGVRAGFARYGLEFDTSPSTCPSGRASSRGGEVPAAAPSGG